MITIYRFIIVISLKLPLLLTSKDFETMSLPPTQDITREELDLIIDALNRYYLSTRTDILIEKFRTVYNSDFDVCKLEAF